MYYLVGIILCFFWLTESSHPERDESSSCSKAGIMTRMVETMWSK